MSPNPVFLYVEDEPFSREIMSLLLSRGLGYKNVYIFDSSQQFIQRLEQLTPKPTIVFVDIHIKPLNGFEMLDILRQHPDFRDVRVIALTASVMNEEVETLKRAGFDGAIAKPIDQLTFPFLLNLILSGEEVWNIA
jgi:CheY-like chemotaxis protein